METINNTSGEYKNRISTEQDEISVKHHPVNLLPCPFCGSKNIRLEKRGRTVVKGAEARGSYVWCLRCGARGERFLHLEMSEETAKKMAVNSWNKRNNQFIQETLFNDEDYVARKEVLNMLTGIMPFGMTAHGLSRWLCKKVEEMPGMVSRTEHKDKIA